jgi:sulfatase maturation enzyme AslB (radical SAM superfamily)
MASPLREQISLFQDSTVVMEFMNAIEEKRMEEIYWVGGEPLMWDIHWDAMARIIDLKFSDRVYVRYNTNLSRTEFKGKNLFELLRQFRDWQVCASIDGTGEIGEYIRTGLNYKKFVENFCEGLAVARNKRQMQLDFTITMPGLQEIRNMFDLSQQLNAKLLTKVTFAFDSQQIMSPMCLPKTLLNEIIDENLEYIRPRATPLQQSLIDVLENMKTRPTFWEEYPKAEIGIRSGKTRCERIDAIRSTDIKKILTDERLLEWWKSI